MSTGALMAPFVFVGARQDETLRKIYTTINAGDIFEMAQTRDSLLDTWPLRKTIDKQVTPQLLDEVTAEHHKGRRLFVLTVNIDSGRPVVWNMGAIAARTSAPSTSSRRSRSRRDEVAFGVTPFEANVSAILAAMRTRN